MSLIDVLIAGIINYYDGLTYFAILILMTMESSIIPVPSEIVMIPAGAFAKDGSSSVFLVIFFGTLGSLIGALLNYYILGKYLGRPFLKKYGKYILISEKKYNSVEKLFLKNDKLYTFVGRFIPVVRHLISIPAGVFNMDLKYFIFYTTIGSFLWCSILTLVGYYYGSDILYIFSHYTFEISFVVLILIIVGFFYFIFKKDSLEKEKVSKNQIK